MFYEKKGYLNEDFKIFYLSDNDFLQYDFHYHDFHKIMLFLQGNVTYHIEGKAYPLEPGDTVIVHSGDIHKPVLNDNSTYERVIIYLSDEYLDSLCTENCNIKNFIEYSKSKNANVLRQSVSMHSDNLKNITGRLIKNLKSQDFGAEILTKAILTELLVALNRLCLTNDDDKLFGINISNSNILSVIEYINKNLSEDLNIDLISKEFFMDRYYLMHLFKKETGFTINNYITYKRLSHFNGLTKTGLQITEACFECGFKSYSTFSRAYKKYYNTSPSRVLD
ncbi:MAG: AraC family transcriptional regulator [Lachnospiraceae bacterium]|nr:AraC family transcriptional regulator [Lachnospiraceae bacterium]